MRELGSTCFQFSKHLEGAFSQTKNFQTFGHLLF